MRVSVFRLIITSVSLLLLAVIGYSSFYELFIEVTGVHTPRILIGSAKEVRFYLNTPTTTALLALLFCLPGIYQSIKVYLFTILTPGRKMGHSWVWLAIFLAGAVMASFAHIADALSHSSPR